ADKRLAAGRRTVEEHRRTSPIFVGEPLQRRESVWCDPTMVAEVRYKTWTEDGLLRESSFLRWRDDKRPEECVERPRPGEPARVEEAEPPAPAPLEVARKHVAFTNAGKVFWPGAGYTKGDLVAYYRAVGPWI